MTNDINLCSISDIIIFEVFDDGTNSKIKLNTLPRYVKNPLHTNDIYRLVVDTATGKDTLHDTVGIIYQTVIENEESTQGTSEQLQSRSEDGECTGEPSVPCTHIGQKRRRAFDAIIPELVPHSKRPKMNDEMSLSDNLRNETTPVSLEIIYKQKFLWMLCHALKIKKNIDVGWVPS